MGRPAISSKLRVCSYFYAFALTTQPTYAAQSKSPGEDCCGFQPIPRAGTRSGGSERRQQAVYQPFSARPRESGPPRPEASGCARNTHPHGASMRPISSIRIRSQSSASASAASPAVSNASGNDVMPSAGRRDARRGYAHCRTDPVLRQDADKQACCHPPPALPRQCGIPQAAPVRWHPVQQQSGVLFPICTGPVRKTCIAIPPLAAFSRSRIASPGARSSPPRSTQRSPPGSVREYQDRLARECG